MTCDTIPTPRFIPSLCTISSSVNARDALPCKHHGTRGIPHVHEAWVLHSATVCLVLAWHMDRHGSGMVYVHVLESGLMDMDDGPSAKDAEHFRYIASSREIIIENTFKCPCLNSRSSRGTPQIKCASSLSSLRV